MDPADFRVLDIPKNHVVEYILQQTPTEINYGCYRGLIEESPLFVLIESPRNDIDPSANRIHIALKDLSWIGVVGPSNYDPDPD